jgi:hypothetical protein
VVLDTLIPLFRETNAPDPIFLVDGVDECSRQEISDVLWGFRQLLSRLSCRVFISGREEVNALQGIPGTTCIWITAENTRADLEVFVKEEIKAKQYDRLISNNEKVLEAIATELLARADGM